MKRIALLLLIGICTTAAYAGNVVWNYAPVDGDAVCCWGNVTSSQNFADNFTLATNTTITGFNLFTGDYPPGGTYNVHLFADNSGFPGTLLFSQDVTASSYTYYGNFNGIDVYEAQLSFTPYIALAGVQYWIGASGNGFQAAQLSLAGTGDPGDGLMAQFHGSSYQFMAGVGDQSYQLTSTPEPSSLTLIGVGFAGLYGTLRRRLGR